MIINHNMSAMYSQRNTGIVETRIVKDIEKLSSGMRINRAGDDASGLAVSEKMRSQIRGLNQAGQNIQNGVSMQIQVEVSQLVDEVDRIASHAQFNGMNLLTGRFAREAADNQLQLHVGANMDQSEKLFVGTMTALALGLTGGMQGGEGDMITISSVEGANMAIGTIDNALKQINKQRADLGAYQNRFELAYNGVAIAAENLQAAESRIRDADMAKQIVEYTKNQILMQSGTAMLAQANTQPQSVIRLLQ